MRRERERERAREGLKFNRASDRKRAAPFILLSQAGSGSIFFHSVPINNLPLAAFSRSGIRPTYIFRFSRTLSGLYVQIYIYIYIPSGDMHVIANILAICMKIVLVFLPCFFCRICAEIYNLPELFLFLVRTSTLLVC